MVQSGASVHSDHMTSFQHLLKFWRLFFMAEKEVQLLRLIWMCASDMNIICKEPNISSLSSLSVIIWLAN
jgi:hypothetical protein